MLVHSGWTKLLTTILSEVPAVGLRFGWQAYGMGYSMAGDNLPHDERSLHGGCATSEVGGL